MAETADPWAGMIDPRLILRAAQEAAKTLADSSRLPPTNCETILRAKSNRCHASSSFSNSSRPGHTLSQSSDNSAKDRKNTCSSSLSMGYASPAPLESLTDPVFDSLAARPPAKVANSLEYGLTHSSNLIIALAGICESYSVTNSVPSPTAHLRGPREWRDGVALLDGREPPCLGFRSGEWEAIFRKARHFMDHCADEAAGRGWTALDLFGVHPFVGAVRVDCCGALMLPSTANATLVSTEAIAFGPLVYRKRTMPQAVLAWKFAEARVQEARGR